MHSNIASKHNDENREAEGTVQVFEEKPPWAGVTVPDGYRLSRTGVERMTDREPQHIAGPVWVSATARDASSVSWGLLVRWLDRDGHQHERAIPQARLHEPGTGLAQELADAGLAIVPGKERALSVYLGAFEPTERLRSVSSLGWTEEPDDSLCYVLPGEILAGQQVPEIIYQPERYSPSAATLYTAGSLAEWKYHVAGRCAGNPLLILSLCAGLAAPILKPARMDGGGFHLYGASSRGKTTALQVAASVFGCGADPAEAPGRTAIHRWNATRNGMEGLAAAHNDGLLALDELGSCDADDFGRVIYDLAGGQGKAAMDANRTLKQQRRWRNVIVSTGEVSAAQKIREARRNAKAGQLLRLMDIPAGDGIIVYTKGQPPADFAIALKRACGQHFGVAGPAFVSALVEEFPDAAVLERKAVEWLDTWTEKMAPRGASPENRRAVRRLALLTVAGLMAQEYGMLPRSLDIPGAMTHVRDSWLTEAASLPDIVRALMAVQSFVLAKRERFRLARDETNGGRPVGNLCGYVDPKRGLYLFTPEGFAEACQGFDPREVARELARRRLLFMNDSRYTSRHSVDLDGKLSRQWLYAVEAAITEADLTNEDTDGGTTETSGTMTGQPEG